MKKFLVMLMVVAMASFLFVGCNGNDIVPDLYTLTMEVNPTGGGTTVPVIGTHPNYTSGTVESVIATPATGYEFVNWSGDVDAPNSASATVTMDSDKTVIANFEAIEEPVTYTLIMQVNPSGGGTTVPTVGTHLDCASGTVVSISATPATDYEFVNWTGGVTGTDNPTTVTMDSDKTVIANFEAIEELETTVAPIITGVDAFDIASTATLYVNKAEAKDGIVVNGTAPTYSEVKVYINGVCAGTGNTEDDGTFSVVVANTDLIKAVKTDGEKVLHAKATDIGKLQSDSSNKVEFTLDTKLPTIDKCSAKAGTPAVKQSVKEISDTSESVFLPGYQPDGIFGCLGPPWDYWVIDSTLLVEGIWTLVVTTIVDLPPFGVLSVGDIITVTATDPTGDTTSFTFPYPGMGWAIYQFVSGVSCSFEALSLNDVGHMAKVKVTCAAKAVPGYIDVTFNEPVTGASILAGTWTAFGATVNLMPIVTVRSATEARLTETTSVIPNLVAGVAYSVSCSGPTDLAGNSILASDPESCTGVVMP